MKTLEILPTKKTLGVKCEPGLMSFEGCSITNNPKMFFKPIIDWVKEYMKTPEELTEILCKFDYIDTASFKNLYTIFQDMYEQKEAGHRIIIKWFFSYEDPEILELGEILKGRIGLDFELVSTT